MKLNFETGEEGDYPLAIRIIDADGKFVVGFSSSVQAHERKGDAVYVAILSQLGLELPRFGDYVMELKSEEMTLAQLPLHLHKS